MNLSPIRTKYHLRNYTAFIKDENLSLSLSIIRNEIKLNSHDMHTHYSTFTPYDKETFDESLETFQQNIKDNFEDLEQITWHDENILLEIRK